jgi:4-hydroxythreonine-4-phosphate dehydrogenase
VLTGGETARRTLEQLRVTSLDPVQILEHGSVLSRIADGRAVITRPGSFGRPDNLVRAVEHLSRLNRGTVAASTPSRKAPL